MPLCVHMVTHRDGTTLFFSQLDPMCQWKKMIPAFKPQNVKGVSGHGKEKVGQNEQAI